MSTPDETAGTTASVETPADDTRIKNLQSEMNRKTQNLDAKLADINAQLQQLSLLGNQVRQQQAPVQEEIPDAMLDPRAYAKYIKDEAVRETRGMLESQQKQQTEVAGLVNMFPELGDSASELTQVAIANYNNMSALEKSAPGAYKLAVQSAALDLGIVPKNKRQAAKPVGDESDDIGARGNADNRQAAPKGKVKLDANTLAFAKLLGKDTSDPKYIERLTKAAGRKSWGKATNRSEY